MNVKDKTCTNLCPNGNYFDTQNKVSPLTNDNSVVSSLPLSLSLSLSLESIDLFDAM
jgi:hypothetical protein